VYVIACSGIFLSSLPAQIIYHIISYYLLLFIIKVQFDMADPRPLVHSGDFQQLRWHQDKLWSRPDYCKWWLEWRH